MMLTDGEFLLEHRMLHTPHTFNAEVVAEVLEHLHEGFIGVVTAAVHASVFGWCQVAGEGFLVVALVVDLAVILALGVLIAEQEGNFELAPAVTVPSLGHFDYQTAVIVVGVFKHLFDGFYVVEVEVLHHFGGEVVAVVLSVQCGDRLGEYVLVVGVVLGPRVLAVVADEQVHQGEVHQATEAPLEVI